jgi:S1-C subfamily serine protease
VVGIDWIVLAVVAAFALLGWRQGFVAGLLSFAGLVGGAILGSKLAPVFLHGGHSSPYAPLVSLAIAVVCGVVVQSFGLRLGLFLRRSVLRPPGLRTLDAVGGVVLGAAAGCVVVWVIGVVALQLPGQDQLRRQVQGSQVLRELNAHFPPRRLLRALARFDPLPAVGGPFARVAPPSVAVVVQPGVRRATPSVVRVLGTACGLGVEGSGWVAGPGLVVTAAHVVAGESDTVVEAGGSRLRGVPVAFDSHNDVAVLRVDGLQAPPLRLKDPRPGAAIAIVGYPLNGPLEASAGRIGETATVLAQDAYGEGPTRRVVTSLGGTVEHGNSGGPAVDASGAVQATVFAARASGSGGYGVPASVVRRDVASASGRVSTGSCVR